MVLHDCVSKYGQLRMRPWQVIMLHTFKYIKTFLIMLQWIKIVELKVYGGKIFHLFFMPFIGFSLLCVMIIYS